MGVTTIITMAEMKYEGVGRSMSVLAKSVKVQGL